MSKKEQSDKPTFEPLGRLLESWRRDRFRSASEMHRSLQPPFAYSTYMEFERGITLPQINQIVWLAEKLNHVPDAGVLLWAELQMPTERLKTLFRGASSVSVPTPAPTQSRSTMTGSSIDQIWVFGKAEHEFMLNEPWFFELCLKLALAYPKLVTFEELGLKTPGSADRFCELYLKPWLEQGRIISKNQGIMSAEPFVKIPNTPDWSAIRARNFHSAYENVSQKITPESIREKLAFSEISTRSLRPEQVNRWVEKLQSVHSDFLNESGLESPSDDQNTCHTLLLAIGPRDLSLPAELIQKCQTN